MKPTRPWRSTMAAPYDSMVASYRMHSRREERMKTPAAWWMILGVLIAGPLGAAPSRAEEPQYDLSKEQVLYCVGYAHLDTQWRWDYATTIDKYLKDTLDQNFDRFEQFGGYVFNFTGAARYALMKEYYPERYERLKGYIAKGRWYVSGSSVDEGDVNVPAPESVIRQVLYGNDFFRREFGKESVDYMLPDCFGFPASMPSVWAHCGLKGFSTQKLSWGSAAGIPFNIGVWEGPDGRSILAAFNPGSYASAIKGRVDLNSKWAARIRENGEKYGVWADFNYYGVGDVGGAPREEDVRNYLASIDNPDSLFKVVLTSSDRMFRDITSDQESRLPRYRGDLLLTEHSAGSITSQAYMKRWNRKNEILADAAERAAVAADWLGGAAYPREKLRRSWVRVLGSQMHDILPGTSIPVAYNYSWNDEIVALNGFAAVLADSVGAVARALDTDVPGVPLVVYNPLTVGRDDPVEATVRYGATVPAAVRVFDATGKEVPSQILHRAEHEIRVLFSGLVPPVSWSVFDVRPSDQPYAGDVGLRISETELENEHYRVRVDSNGDVASIVDKRDGNRELLLRPARLVFTHERPRNWPAWNMDWSDRQRPPIDAVSGPAKVRVVERGPVRVALEIEREARNSIIRQQVRLSRGTAGRRVEFPTQIDWQSTECALRASFPLTVANPVATYNLGLGTIERDNNDPKKYEVPSHEWIDLTDAAGAYGVSILEDCKYGSDKPANNELRLTLLYTPGVRRSFLDQHSQDWGRHETVYALYGHTGDWRQGRSEWQGRRMNQPLHVFQAPRHDGPLGRSFSLLKLDTQQVDVRAVKLAERSDHVIIRLQELWGREARDVALTLAGGIVEAREVDGQERAIGPATVRDGKLMVDLTPFSPRSFAVRLAATPATLEAPRGLPVALPFDVDVVSTDANRSDGRLDSEGRTLPAEMLPATLVSEGIEFDLAPAADGRPNAVACRGQTIELPAGDYNGIYLLAAADEDVTGRFIVGQQAQERRVQCWTGFVGQWDNRLWGREFDEVDYRCEGRVTGIERGYIKRDTIAWFCTHRHHPTLGNEAYRFSYLFKYAVDREPGTRKLRLPDEPRIKLFALTVARNDNDAVRAAAPLYDDFTDRKPIDLRHKYPAPPVPVFQGIDPVAAVAIDRQERFEDLSMGAPVSTDYADQARGNGVLFRYYDGDGEYQPHPGSGAVADTFPRLNDGDVARNDDDTQRCVWYDCEGRFHVDLRRSLPIAGINTYSWHIANRAPQYFSLWGSNANEMPSPGFKHGEHEGWTLLAVVNTRELGDGKMHGSSVTPDPSGEPLGPFRHLLWVAQDVGQGTFFTEIDVHVAE